MGCGEKRYELITTKKIIDNQYRNQHYQRSK